MLSCKCAAGDLPVRLCSDVESLQGMDPPAALDAEQAQKWHQDAEFLEQLIDNSQVSITLQPRLLSRSQNRQLPMPCILSQLLYMNWLILAWDCPPWTEAFIINTSTTLAHCQGILALQSMSMNALAS